MDNKRKIFLNCLHEAEENSKLLIDHFILLSFYNFANM